MVINPVFGLCLIRHGTFNSKGPFIADHLLRKGRDADSSCDKSVDQNLVTGFRRSAPMMMRPHIAVHQRQEVMCPVTVTSRWWGH